MSHLLDIIYPPRCILCTSFSRNLICSVCLDLLMISEGPRCIHCFSPVEAFSLCPQCAHSVKLSAKSAYLFESSPLARELQRVLAIDSEEALHKIVASFFVLLLNRLDWPVPDKFMIVKHVEHHRALFQIAEELARMFDRQLLDEFCFRNLGPFQWRLQRKKEERLDNQKILLIDWGHDINILKQAITELKLAFPQAVHILSIFKWREK